MGAERRDASADAERGRRDSCSRLAALVVSAMTTEVESLPWTPEADAPEAWNDTAVRRSVSLVIPARNEARNITWVMTQVPDVVDEIILVDGDSIDGTVERALAVRPDTRVVIPDRPGKGRALREGFRAATGDVIVFMDADGSMSPAEIGRYLDALDNGYDLVKGSRFLWGGGSLDITSLRRLGNWGLLGTVNSIYRSSFTDLCYGFIAFHRRHLERLHLTTEGFEIETEIVVRALKAGLRVAE